MKKRLCFLIILVYFFAASLTLASSAEASPVVLDFYYEEEFDYYYSTFNGCDILWEDNAMHMTSTQDLELGEKGDPFVTLTLDYMFTCDDYPYMKIKLKNLSDAPVFEMHFSTTSSGGIVAACCTHVDITSKDTEYKEYVFNVPEKNLESMSVNQLTNEETMWTGDIVELRLDGMWFAEPSGQVPYGSEMYIEYVAFFQTEEEANAFDATAFRAARTPKPTPSPTPERTPTPEKTASPIKTATQKPNSTSSSTSSKDSNSMLPLIIGVVVAVSAIVVIAIIVILKKRKTNS